MEYLRLIRRPSLQFFPGVKVDETTELSFKSASVTQTLNNLIFHCVRSVCGDGYEGRMETTIYLQPGDVLIYQDDIQGYIKPVEPFVTIAEAAMELDGLKEL